MQFKFYPVSKVQQPFFQMAVANVTRFSKENREFEFPWLFPEKFRTVFRMAGRLLPHWL